MKPASQNGFTLIEMAIVLMIVALLLGGMLVPLSAQMDQRNISDTQKSLSEIKEALIGYALANGRLPCPAVPTTPTGQTVSGVGAGTAVPLSSNVCPILTGVVPWATLGVTETDAWGDRFTYRVTSDYSDSISSATYTSGCVSPAPSPAPTQASFALCSAGNLNVRSAAPPAANTIIAGSVPAVIISHGKNRAGAYTPQGTQVAVGSNADEVENSDGTLDTNYVGHTLNSTFDDLVVWVSPNILNNRMVAAGKLP
jgi:prepilin-type N-terminal cleavage/methylation domain-containing protein